MRPRALRSQKKLGVSLHPLDPFALDRQLVPGVVVLGTLQLDVAVPLCGCLLPRPVQLLLDLLHFGVHERLLHLHGRCDLVRVVQGSQELHLSQRHVVRELHLRHKQLRHVLALSTIARCRGSHQLHQSCHGRVGLPDHVQLPDGARPGEEGVKELPQEVVVGFAGRVHSVLQDTYQANIQTLADHGLVPVPRQVLVSVSRDAVHCHHLRHALHGAEVLVLGADDVQRGHIQLAPDEPCLTLRGEVAVFDAEGIDKPPNDHLPVALVVEAGHRHGTL
mmetsp:Transcript_85536/g.205001  ORF Transcript_85536/g.205001 Transcript_85536/m.205001 type:complete len:277 (-) Transcript_85536:875-1705(-)